MALLLAGACGESASKPHPGAGEAGAASVAGAGAASGAGSGSGAGAGAASVSEGGSGSVSGSASVSGSDSGSDGGAAGDPGCELAPIAMVDCGDAIESSAGFSVMAEDGTATLSEAAGLSGQKALHLVTDSGLLVTLRYAPAQPLSATEAQDLRLLLRAKNTNTGWQGNVPAVTLEDAQGKRRTYTPPSVQYPVDGTTWVELRVPLAGGGGYDVSGDSIDFAAIKAIELTADTWEAGFEIDFDGLSFVAPGARCAVDCPADCSGRGSCDLKVLGCVCEVGAKGEACAACRDGFSLQNGHCQLSDDGDFDTWPNAVSQVNGDAWLQVHHQSIKTLAPRVLALNFVNPSVPANVETLVDQVIDGFREGSRPLGSEFAQAEPGLDYELVDIVDLRDGVAGRPPAPQNFAYQNSTLYPRRPQGEPGAWGLDYAELFGDGFAKYYGFEKPNAPGTYFNLCELVESGRIHELWLVGSGDVPDANAAEVLESKQRYDAGRQPIAGQFERCAGNGCFDEDVPHCARSVRIGFVNYNRGPGCYLHSQGHGLESAAGHQVVPALSEWFLPFAGFDLDRSFGLPASNLYGLIGEGDSITYPKPDTMVLHRAGGTQTVSDYQASCGNVHFPANAGAHYDYGSNVEVASDCRDFGRNVAACRPRSTQPVNASMWTEYEQLSPDCGGAFLVYWYQHMPGFRSQQLFDDGRDMLSVWPFLFY